MKPYGSFGQEKKDAKHYKKPITSICRFTLIIIVDIMVEISGTIARFSEKRRYAKNIKSLYSML